MSTTIRFKRRVTGAAGAPASLKSGEIAWNMQDGYIYGGYGDDGGGNATSIKILTKQDWVNPSGVYQPINSNLNSISGMATTSGIIAQTAPNTFAPRSIAGTANRVAVTNGDASGGNPTIDLATITVGGTVTGGYTKFTTDAYGRVSNQGQASISDLSAATADFSMGGFKLTNVGTPVAGTDVPNKTYVDNAMMGLDGKAPVRVTTTANTALSGGSAFPTFDGVVTAAGDRVLLKNQTNAFDNGIYVVGGTGAAWTLTRATDMNVWNEIPGALITVEEGTTLGDSVWLSTANNGGTLGTTAVPFTRIDAGAAGTFTTAGNGLTSAGATISALASTGIAVSGSGIALAGQALALYNVATAADQVIYATGVGTFAVTAFGSYGRSLVGAANAAAAQTTLGLGSMATQAASAVAITGGTIDGITLDGGTF